MRHRSARPALWVVTGMTLMVAAAASILSLGRAIQRRHVETALARFEANPSQKGADELARLLGSRIATPEQGQRILKAIFYPTVITHPAYPLGTVPTFLVERRFHVRLAGMAFSENVGIWIDGKKTQGHRGNTSDTTSHLYRLDSAPQEPGLYRTELHCYYIASSMIRKTSWYWRPRWGDLPHSLLPRRLTTYSEPTPVSDYVCRFSVPVELNVIASHGKPIWHPSG